MWKKAPKRPDDVFDLFINDMKSLFGREVVAIHLYGSGARGDYQPGDRISTFSSASPRRGSCASIACGERKHNGSDA